MKLLSCHVENFGKLSDFSYIFEEDLNVLLAENGWGKSTLAAFLKVMFYGFEGENRKSEDGNERLRYKPWNGGTYGGSVNFSKGDREYRIHRSFGMRKKEDTFLLFDDKTGLPSSDFTESVGEELFGIDRASFTRTVFWSQQDHMTEATAMIQAKIGDLTAGESDLPDYDRAIRLVQREIDRLSPDRSSGQIRKKEARASVLEAESARIPQLKRQLAETTAAHQDLAAQLDGIRRERQEWMAAERASQAAAIAEGPLGDVRSASSADDSKRAVLTARLTASRKRLESLQRIRHRTAAEGHREREEYLRVQKERAREEHSASLAMSRSARTLRIITASALAASLLFFVLVGTKALPLPALRASLQRLSSRMKQMEAQIREETQSQRALKARLDRIPASSSRSGDGSTGTGRPGSAALFADELAEFDRREEECRGQLTRAEHRTEDLRRQIRECLDSEEQLAVLRKELITLRRQYDTCVRTASFLEEARSSFNSRYMNPFLRSFRRHYGMLTGESAQDLQTNADFGISVMSEGLPRDPSLMSEGTRDLISLCRRMAMIDAMYPGEKPFLVLDDPFSNLDDERVKGGMRFLRDASLEYQILYLTCHESRV